MNWIVIGTRRKPRKSKKQTEQSKNQWRSIIIGGAIIAGIIGLGYLLFTNLRGPTPPEPIAGVVDHEHQDRGHIEHEVEAGDQDPQKLAIYPLAVPYLLNPAGYCCVGHYF